MEYFMGIPSEGVFDYLSWFPPPPACNAALNRFPLSYRACPWLAPLLKRAHAAHANPVSHASRIAGASRFDGMGRKELRLPAGRGVKDTVRKTG